MGGKASEAEKINNTPIVLPGKGSQKCKSMDGLCAVKGSVSEIFNYDNIHVVLIMSLLEAKYCS